jgi:hypothetical protein
MTTVVTKAPIETRTAARCRQLVAASERTTLDPFTEVDWSQPIDDSAFHLPPETLPLYGTPEWEAMDEAERIAYSRHETAALCGAGIWFENMLMQVVLRHLAEMPATDPAHRYLLIEVADECRHSQMFGEFIRRAGTPSYGPATPPAINDLEQLPGRRAMSYLLILAVEELLDHTNRLTMKDDRCHPVSRQIAKLHVLEEARHVSFAKTYLAEAWPNLCADEQRAVADLAPVAVSVVAELSVDPAVYAELGITAGEAVARANPHHRAHVIAGLAKLTSFLTELGAIDAGSRGAWAGLGLLDPLEEPIDA